ncbi:hypothetical protein GY21_04040 [Cryobacterium roopkundense]|uniref:Uncharacterized protein n=1 Tax=Cryobacterium roopkundense TaxID=1001240 RepID=A0A099JMV5_9MICO|nr:hypothetical protein [Cryobacterium roopkundense]KGJ79704.1 hypothetical protein GY21_04040 [Cryobacterium roopkundense]MBB5642689.1 hypothetical protein [Cryobacterium roopkundense]
MVGREGRPARGRLRPLVHALAAPDDRFGFTQACTADAQIVPELWLQNAAGEAVRVAWPRDACLKTKPAVAVALTRLDLTETTTLPVRLVESRAALDGGCTMTAGPPAERALMQKNMAVQTMPAQSGSTSGPSAVQPVRPAPAPSWAGADAADVCLYTEAPPSDDVDSVELPELEGLISTQSFDFSGAAVLTPDVITRVGAAASAVSALAPPCEVEVTRFAVVWPERYNTRIDAPISVELDGCGRLYTPDFEALVLPPELLATLAAL